jgi:hypothetical protein
MVATQETDNAIKKFYRDLGYTDKKAGKQPKINLDGLVAKWYNEGFDASCPFWNAEAS